MHPTTIIIGSFHNADYAVFSKNKEDGVVYFLHAPATWYIRSKEIRQHLIHPADMVAQSRLEKIDEDALCLVRRLSESSKTRLIKGIHPIEILRFKIIRYYSRVMEARLVLEACISYYRPTELIVDSSCYQNERSEAYARVAELISKKYSISIRHMGSFNRQNGDKHNYAAALARFFKKIGKSILALVINTINCRKSSNPIIVYYGAFHQLAQIMEWLHLQGCYRLVYFKEGIPLKSLPFIIRHGIEWKRINSHSRGSGHFYITRIRELLDEAFESDSLAGTFFDGEQYLMAELKSYIEKQLSKELQALDHLIDAAKDFFDNADIKGVFVEEDQLPPVRIIVDTANAHRKETFLICHGILAEKSNFVFSVRNIYTYGSIVSQRIKHYSASFSPKIFEVGMPRLERLKRMNAIWARHRLCNDFAIPYDSRILLFTTGNMSPQAYFYPNNIKDSRQGVCFRALIRLKQFLIHYPQVHLIIKLHPYSHQKQEEKDSHRIFFEGTRVITVEHYDIDILVKGCDAVLHCLSTVAYHGFIAHKPTGRIRANIENALWEFSNSQTEKIIDVDAPSFENDIHTLLFNTQERDNLCKNAEVYLKEYHPCEDFGVRERFLAITNRILQGTDAIIKK